MMILKVAREHGAEARLLPFGLVTREEIDTQDSLLPSHQNLSAPGR